MLTALTPQEWYLRKACGLPGRPSVTPDIDDPAVRELTTAQAAAAAHVPEATIRDWARASRPLIRSVAGPGEPPRYLELDVLRAEAHTRRARRRAQLLDEAAADLDQASTSAST